MGLHNRYVRIPGLRAHIRGPWFQPRRVVLWDIEIFSFHRTRHTKIFEKHSKGQPRKEGHRVRVATKFDFPDEETIRALVAQNWRDSGDGAGGGKEEWFSTFRIYRV